MNQNTDDILTMDEVAANLKVSAETARRLCDTGKISFILVGTGEKRKSRRVLRSSLREFKTAEKRSAVKDEMRNVMRIVGGHVEQRW